MFEIEYYIDPNGNKPAEEFIDSLDVRMKVKVFGRLELLEEKGQQLGMSFQGISRHLERSLQDAESVAMSSTLHSSVAAFCVASEEGR